MSEWKGPWKCEKCGKVYVGSGTGTCPVFPCFGRLLPHDRRSPNPLLPLLREAREALADAIGAVRWGADRAGAHFLSEDGMAMFCGTLRRTGPLLTRLDDALRGEVGGKHD